VLVPKCCALERAYNPSSIVASLRLDFGLSAEDIALATGAAPRTVVRWEMTGRAVKKYGELLVELKNTVLFLENYFTHRGVNQWLHARSRFLDDETPLEAFAEKRGKAVRQAMCEQVGEWDSYV